MNKFGCLLLALLAAGCQPSAKFSTDLTPPKVDATLEEVYPESIGNEVRLLSRLSLGEGLYGTQAEYGAVAQIQVIQTGNQEILEKFRQSYLRPILDKFSQKISIEKNGRFQIEASGENGARLVTWSNPPWVFVVQANSEAHLAEVVEKFAFIKYKE